MNRLKDARNAAGMSQEAVAKLLDVTQPTVSGWEREEYPIDSKNVIALCELFGMTPNQFLAFGDEAHVPIIASKPVGAFITYADGETESISPDEEYHLMRRLIEFRRRQAN